MVPVWSCRGLAASKWRWSMRFSDAVHVIHVLDDFVMDHIYLNIFDILKDFRIDISRCFLYSDIVFCSSCCTSK